jgi:arginine deiminase
VSHTHGVDSEVGRLRSVLVHRPGLELRRLTPRMGDRLLFDRVPWAARAQHEHDAFTQSLRDEGVEVLYITELLQDTLEYQPARDEAIESVLRARELGDELRARVRARLDALPPEDLGQVLIAGLAPDDLPDGSGLVFQMLDRHDFVIDPVPNLMFTRDSSFWVGDRIAIASPAEPHRRREADLLRVIYDHHPRFAGIKRLYGSELENVDGGDVLLLAPSVLAIGVGQRTTAAGAERLARHALEAGLAHTVLAIPLDQSRGAGYLDTRCTMIDADTVLMHPALAYTLNAHLMTLRPAGLRVSRPQPFLEAAAQAMGIDRLRVIDTGLDPVGGRGPWDDGGNALALGPRLAVCSERHAQTIARLEGAGVAVIQVPGSELASSRGGPRCLSSPVSRDPGAEGEPESEGSDRGEPAGQPGREKVRLSAGTVAELSEPGQPAPARPEAADTRPDQLPPAAYPEPGHPERARPEQPTPVQPEPELAPV